MAVYYNRRTRCDLELSVEISRFEILCVRENLHRILRDCKLLA